MLCAPKVLWAMRCLVLSHLSQRRATLAGSAHPRLQRMWVAGMVTEADGQPGLHAVGPHHANIGHIPELSHLYTTFPFMRRPSRTYDAAYQSAYMMCEPSHD